MSSFFKSSFLYLWAALGLHSCVEFSAAAQAGWLPAVEVRLLKVVPSVTAEHRPETQVQ